MRFEIDRGTLAEMLGVLVNTLPSRTTYPVLQNVLLEVADGRLSLSGTDLDTFVRKDYTLSGKFEDGRVALPGRKLLEITREHSTDQILLYSKNGRIHLEAGNSKVAFSGLDPAEFPEVPGLPEGATLEFPVATVMELFDAVSFAVSKDDSRPAMTGINWEVTKTEMRMVATDGHRLAFVRQKGKYAAGFKIIIAPKVFSFLPRGADTLTVHSDPAKIGVVCAETTVISRVIEGPYPDYERVIPKKSHPGKAEIEQEVLGPALRRAAVLAHPVGKLVALGFSNDGLVLEAETPELGSSKEAVPCTYTGDPVRIGFNAAYMLEILRHLETDKVAVELQSALTAGLITPVADESDLKRTYLLMPIRLD
jgi:DNA polymerase-3 subunit beta